MCQCCADHENKRYEKWASNFSFRKLFEILYWLGSDTQAKLLLRASWMVFFKSLVFATFSVFLGIYMKSSKFQSFLALTVFHIVFNYGDPTKTARWLIFFKSCSARNTLVQNIFETWRRLGQSYSFLSLDYFPSNRLVPAQYFQLLVVFNRKYSFSDCNSAYQFFF